MVKNTVDSWWKKMNYKRAQCGIDRHHPFVNASLTGKIFERFLLGIACGVVECVCTRLEFVVGRGEVQEGAGVVGKCFPCHSQRVYVDGSLVSVQLAAVETCALYSRPYPNAWKRCTYIGI